MGDVCEMVVRKYDGSLHWHTTLLWLGEDDHGVVHGSDDDVVPLANSRALAAAHPFVDLRVVEGADHFFEGRRDDGMLPQRMLPKGAFLDALDATHTLWAQLDALMLYRKLLAVDVLEGARAIDPVPRRCPRWSMPMTMPARSGRAPSAPPPPRGGTRGRRPPGGPRGGAPLRPERRARCLRGGAAGTV